jgi:hypothetical protein
MRDLLVNKKGMTPSNSPIAISFSIYFPTKAFPKQLSAARSIAFRVLFQAFQVSDVGSIPIARPITHGSGLPDMRPTPSAQPKVSAFADAQAALGDAVNAAAFFRTNSCTLSGR